METSAAGTAFEGCNDIIQAAAVQQRPGKKLAWNPVTNLATSYVIDELNQPGGIYRECMSIYGSGIGERQIPRVVSSRLSPRNKAVRA
jgi:hypothetical protein